jgi:hypothetical protein
MKNNFIKTGYKYKEGWQFQDIYVCTKTFDILRTQNFKGEKGKIAFSADHIKVGDKGWDILFRQHGLKTYMEFEYPEGY